MPSRIVIPTLGIDAPVLKVSWCKKEINGQAQAAWEVPDGYAAGWHETSALLGVVGNTVLNGHNTTNGEIFRDLYTLKPGDDIVLYSEQISRTYAVSETLILREADQPLEVRLENARYVAPTDDERLTLVTCHPYGSLRNRLIVIARPDKPEPYSEPEEE
ncbi:MAG: sortase [Anaerolineae bacterium]|jgi:sortase A